MVFGDYIFLVPSLAILMSDSCQVHLLAMVQFFFIFTLGT